MLSGGGGGIRVPGVTPPRLVSAARVHAALRELPVRSLQAATGGATILVLAPHPDDETLGCGGLIAQAAASGQGVHVLVLTDGTGSHPDSAAYPAPRLRRVREGESREAARVLGLAPERVAFLGLRDTRAPKAGPAAERAAAAIAAHAVQCGARVFFSAWRHDPHGDHLAGSILARRAAALTGAALFEYPVWGWTLPGRRLLPADPISGFRLDISAQVAAKRRAIACHRSQLGQVITDDPGGFTMAPGFVDLFTSPVETFVAVGG